MVTWALTGPPAEAMSVGGVSAKASRQVSSGASGEGFSQLQRENEKTFSQKDFHSEKTKSCFQHLMIVI